MIQEVSNFQELAWKIWASFKLPQWMSEIYNVENYYLAPLAPRCLHWKEFLLLLNPTFPCHDIREEQLEKTIAYMQALQYWEEKSHLPMLGQPRLLARCILKLKRMMEPYVSFSNDAILDGVASWEEFLEDQTKVAIPRIPSCLH